MGWNLVEKANHSKYEPKVHNMLKVAMYEDRSIGMMIATSICKIDMKWHETWVIAQVYRVINKC